VSTDCKKGTKNFFKDFAKNFFPSSLRFFEQVGLVAEMHLFYCHFMDQLTSESLVTLHKNGGVGQIFLLETIFCSKLVS